MDGIFHIYKSSQRSSFLGIFDHFEILLITIKYTNSDLIKLVYLPGGSDGKESACSVGDPG